MCFCTHICKVYPYYWPYKYTVRVCSCAVIGGRMHTRPPSLPFTDNQSSVLSTCGQHSPLVTENKHKLIPDPAVVHGRSA